MARLNITDAADAAGVSRGTIYNHIRKGRLSATVSEDGHKRIDVAELERVYGTLNRVDVQGDVQLNTLEQASNAELEVLKKEVEMLRRELRKTEEREREARDQVKELLDVVKSQTRLLGAGTKETPAKEEQPKKERRWWPFGKD